MEGKKFYLTTPIYYVNGSPHIGHAHTTVMGDIFKRAMGMQGISTFYTTGVDEHGQKNAREIEKSGLTAEEYLDGQCLKFTSLFKKLDIQADYFVRTSRESHKKGVTAILDRLYGEEKIVKKAYSGLYCPGCEQFKTASDLDDQGRCPDHLTIPVAEEESNYFFPLEPHREWLITYINNHEEWISPKIYRNKVLDMLSAPLPDLCVSRPKSRVSLGVELPFDRDYVAYVWFDALINYITSLGYPDLSSNGEKLWSGSCHLMAKDIIKTHCIYWPIMLKALDLNPVKKNLIHGFWVGKDGRKMSKTLGNGVDPHDFIERFGADPVRAFLAARMGRHEARIGEELFKDFYNGFLANTLGNVYLRSVRLIEKYTDSLIPSMIPSHEDSSFLDSLCTMAKKAAIKEPDFDSISILINGINEMGKGLNSYVDNRKPWILAKDSGTKKELLSVLRTSIEGVRLLFETAWPVMPEKSEQVLTLLASTLPEPGKRHKFKPCRLREGETIHPGKVLFPRM